MTKSTGRKPASRSKDAARAKAGAAKTKDEAAAALKEGSGPRTVTVRGIEFELPDPMPFSVVLASRRVYRAEDGAEVAFAQLDLAEAYVGDQIERLYDVVKSMDDGADAIRELLEAVDEEYGTDTGESSASPGS